jgi:hypothetical protein
MSLDSTAMVVPVPHARYSDARTKAHLINVEVNDAQREYAEQLTAMIHALQKQFYTKYGDRMQELEDLEEAIAHIQHTGMKSLKRQLTKMHMDADAATPGEQKLLRRQAQSLCDQYGKQYMPKDKYQQFKDREATELRAAIMGGRGTTGRDHAGHGMVGYGMAGQNEGGYRIGAGAYDDEDSD